MKKRKLKITCINLGGFKSDDNYMEKLKEYIRKEEADIIAGQEIPKGLTPEDKFVIDGEAIGRSKFFTGFCIKNEDYNNGLNSYAEMEEIWGDLFDVCSESEYKSGYFAEKWIKFCGENIRIINVHIGGTYEIQLKLTLLKYLSRLQNKYTIIMGDFNAAKKEQTGNHIEGNDRFLRKIESKGYVELLDKEEQKGDPHYTYYDKNKIEKKLDHVFVSQKLKEAFKIEIGYDDEVNYNYPRESKVLSAFTDHSAIRITIGEKIKYD